MMSFDLTAYANAIAGWVEDLDAFAKSKSADVSMEDLYTAAQKLKETTGQFEEWAQVWHDTVWGSGGYESNVMAIQRVDHNARMASFDTHLLDLAKDGGVRGSLPHSFDSVS